MTATEGSRSEGGRELDLAGLFCALHVWTVFAIALSNAFLALSGLAALAALAVRRGTRPPWRRVRWPLLSLLVYAAAVVAATIASSDTKVSWEASHELLGLSTLPLCLFLIRGRSALRRVLDGLVLVALLCALHGLGEALLYGTSDLDHRIRGPFSHYMTFAGVLLLADVLLLAELIFARSRRPYWKWLALLAINLALAFSLTRTAWLVVAFLLVVMLALAAPRRLILLPVAMALLLFLAPGTWVERGRSIFDLHDESNRERLRMASTGLQMIAERPLLGHGPGLVRHLYPSYMSADAQRDNVEHLHNSYLQIAAEEGGVALLAFLALLTAAITRSGRGMRVELRWQPAAPLFAPLFFALVGFALAALFEDAWSDGEVQRIALFLIAAPFCASRPRGDGSQGV